MAAQEDAHACLLWIFQRIQRWEVRQPLLTATILYLPTIAIYLDYTRCCQPFVVHLILPWSLYAFRTPVHTLLLPRFYYRKGFL